MMETEVNSTPGRYRRIIYGKAWGLRQISHQEDIVRRLYTGWLGFSSTSFLSGDHSDTTCQLPATSFHLPYCCWIERNLTGAQLKKKMTYFTSSTSISRLRDHKCLATKMLNNLLQGRQNQIPEWLCCLPGNYESQDALHLHRRKFHM